MAACAWNTQAIKGRMCKMCFCRRGHGSAARERQVSVWCFDYWLWKFLPLSSRSGRLCSSQPLIICPLPIVMCTLSPSLDSSVYTSAPHLSSLSLLFLFPYYEKEGGKDKGGRKCKYRSFFCDTSGLITPTSPLQLARDDLPSISPLLSLISITLWSLSPPVNPPLLSGLVRTQRTAGWPKRNLWLQGMRFALQMKQDRSRGDRGASFLCPRSDGAAFLCFSALPAAYTSISIFLVGVATTFSLW